MPIDEISSLLLGIKGTMDIAKGLMSAHDAHTLMQARTEILEKLLTLQENALSLQERYSSLINQRDQLAQKLTQNEDWAKTQVQYQLKEIHPRVYAYSAKSALPALSNQPLYCSNCFASQRISILVYQGNGENYHKFLCHGCNKEFQFYTGDTSGSDFEIHSLDGVPPAF
jgi:hypothetical protein